MTIGESKITTKRQITLPLKLVQRLKLNPGDPVIFEEKDGHIEITTRTKFTIHDFIKKYQGKVKIKLTDAELKKAREEVWGKMRDS